MDVENFGDLVPKVQQEVKPLPGHIVLDDIITVERASPDNGTVSQRL